MAWLRAWLRARQRLWQQVVLRHAAMFLCSNVVGIHQAGCCLHVRVASCGEQQLGIIADLSIAGCCAIVFTTPKALQCVAGCACGVTSSATRVNDAINARRAMVERACLLYQTIKLTNDQSQGAQPTYILQSKSGSAASLNSCLTCPSTPTASPSPVVHTTYCTPPHCMPKTPPDRALCRPAFA